ncbi:MAG: alpha-1,2-fucosyltransferase [Muribaculum sp.]|nr:alpha-1,2-fucosyltransferase [Muribaculum sp.]
MKIVRIFGGLGNQMFQYALAVALGSKGNDVRIDASCMRGYPLHNGFELKRIFNADIPQASLFELLWLGYPLPHYRLWQVGKRILPKRQAMIVEDSAMEFNKDVFKQKRDYLLEGYWQTEKYFSDWRDEILDAFRFPKFASESENQMLAKEIACSNAVSVHVRRGDYLKISNTSGICTEGYYNKAIKLIIDKCNPEMFVFFSDDIDWCKEHFKDLAEGHKVVFVDWNKGEESYRDMQLMSLCSHNIIANSSFSWWGAWLNNNPDKVVITPSRWMNGPGWPDIIPDAWIKI